MYKGDYTLVKAYGVDYVCICAYERAFASDNHFVINYSAFDDPTRFDLQFDAVVDGGCCRIYEVE